MSGPRLDAEWLAKLLEEKRVLKSGNWKRFSQESLEYLSSTIRVMAFRHKTPVRLAPETLPFQDDSGHVAAPVVLESLLARRHEYERLVLRYEGDSDEHHGAAMASACRESISVIDAAITALERAVPLLRPVAAPELRATWRDYAIDLARGFLGWRRIIQPGKPMGISEGPVSTYVAAVVPFITGETPTTGNVARFLKENRQAIEAVEPAAEEPQPVG